MACSMLLTDYFMQTYTFSLRYAILYINKKAVPQVKTLAAQPVSFILYIDYFLTTLTEEPSVFFTM